MELIRPVRSGPVLTEQDLQTTRLSPTETEELLRQLAENPQPGPVFDSAAEIVNSLDRLVQETNQQQAQLSQLFQNLESYEESLVAKGYHPVHKEPLDDSGEEAAGG